MKYLPFIENAGRPSDSGWHTKLMLSPVALLYLVCRSFELIWCFKIRYKSFLYRRTKCRFEAGKLRYTRGKEVSIHEIRLYHSELPGTFKPPCVLRM